MATSQGFQFKQFFVAHDQCAMKVNTDSILLGALADISDKQRVLDLGTGSGLLLMMLAQRSTSDTQLIGVELEQAACQQAKQNVQNSPWADRIEVIQADAFQQDFANRFDLIVSNPPYFSDSLACRNPQRDLARHTNQRHLAWLQLAKKWLSLQGNICFVLPIEAADRLLGESHSIGLACREKWMICPRVGQAPKRAVLTFVPACAFQGEPQVRALAIYQVDNCYTPEFIALTRAFYLHF